VKRQLLPVMQANRPRPKLTFTYDVPAELPHPDYRLVLVFDSAPDLTAARLRRRVPPQGTTERPLRAVRRLLPQRAGAIAGRGLDRGGEPGGPQGRPALWRALLGAVHRVPADPPATAAIRAASPMVRGGGDRRGGGESATTTARWVGGSAGQWSPTAPLARKRHPRNVQGRKRWPLLAMTVRIRTDLIGRLFGRRREPAIRSATAD
jgi:hypothetical protein